MKPVCAVFTNVAPLYSRPLWYQLASSPNIDYVFYSSKNGFGGIKTIDISESNSVSENGNLKWGFLKNILIGNIIVWQTGIISKCITTNYSAYILYGEMNSISNWIAAIICRIRRKPLLFWGHGLYGNEKKLKKFFRLLYYRLANSHLVYSNMSRNYLIDSGFDSDRILTVYNSLDYCTHTKQYSRKNSSELNDLRLNLFPDHPDLPVVLFIGRLTSEKKLSLLFKALSVCRSRGNLYNCLIVGYGEEYSELKKMSQLQGLEGYIKFFGTSYDETVNSKLIMMSDCCVSPGNVGLTAIHSLSLGTPVITHSNFFNQGPEVEAVIPGETGLYFTENSASSLSYVIDDMLLNRKKLLMESKCIEQVKSFWTPTNQATIFDKAVTEAIKHN